MRLRLLAFVSALAAAPACGSAAPPEAVGTSTSAIDTICGESAAASLDSIPAYTYCGDFDVYTDNGVDTRSTGGTGWVQTEGGYGYQCVEYAVRYFYFKWSTAQGWFVGYAKDMCATHPSDVSVTSSPVHGDLAVFTPGCDGADPTAGHVAAIDTVATSTISVVQENPAGTYTWDRSCVSCYLHAAANGGKVDPCTTAPEDGAYCGQSPQWGGGTTDTLYDCEGGATKTATPCAYGCDVEAYGTNDMCNPPPVDAGTSDAGAAPTPDGGSSSASDSGRSTTPARDAGGGHDARASGPGDPDAAAGVPGGAAGGCASAGPPRERGLPWALAPLGLVIARRLRRASPRGPRAPRARGRCG